MTTHHTPTSEREARRAERDKKRGAEVGAAFMTDPTGAFNRMFGLMAVVGIGGIIVGAVVTAIVALVVTR